MNLSLDNLANKVAANDSSSNEQTFIVDIYISKNAKKSVFYDIVKAKNSWDAENKCIGKKYQIGVGEANLRTCRKAETVREIV